MVAGILVVDLDAFEVLFHDEVDDPGDRVRTVGCGGAAGQDLDPFDQRAGHLVDVRRQRENITEPHAVPVGQNQGAL